MKRRMVRTRLRYLLERLKGKAMAKPLNLTPLKNPRQGTTLAKDRWRSPLRRTFSNLNVCLLCRREERNVGVLPKENTEQDGTKENWVDGWCCKEQLSAVGFALGLEMTEPYLLDAMVNINLEVSDDNLHYRITLCSFISSPLPCAHQNPAFTTNRVDGEAQDIRDRQPFPEEYLEPLRRLWEDLSVQKCWERGNKAALPDNLSYFFVDLDRLFDQFYVPIEQDIVHTRARTIGITETVFNLRENEMLMVDVGGQKSERRKWIHCFQDVTSILILVSLSGYDQCLIEDKDAILFLNKDDLFQKKYHIPTSRTSSLTLTGKEEGEWKWKWISNDNNKVKVDDEQASRLRGRILAVQMTNANDEEVKMQNQGG
ncbi:G-protein alpha subunit-domain-containing protein [Cytidiella melzeri]|nr:G-protein alpha subunit-domain-containing protein [Cytidiella melzeri]